MVSSYVGYDTLVSISVENHFELSYIVHQVSIC